MRIAVDAMGGDFAPREIVAGAVQAAQTLPEITRLFLVGQEDPVRAELARHGHVPPSLEVRHASEVVDMGEKPAVAIRRKKDSSINRAMDLVKHGEADAFFSAGNTGAAVASAQLKLRSLEGVQRPAIATVFPSPVSPFVLLDAGANSDCTARMLVEFAVMGAVYAREVVGCPAPRVGLMSIGGEDAKGNEITKEAFRLLQVSGLDFQGNVEGHDLFEGKVDVVVCDGFVGNVVLKTSESVAHVMSTWLRQAFTANLVRKAGALLLRNALRELKSKIDPAAHGGAPLLGVNGIVIIGHGASSAEAARNGIRAAVSAVGHNVTRLIIEGVRRAEGGA